MKIHYLHEHSSFVVVVVVLSNFPFSVCWKTNHTKLHKLAPYSAYYCQWAYLTAFSCSCVCAKKKHEENKSKGIKQKKQLAFLSW